MSGVVCISLWVCVTSLSVWFKKLGNSFDWFTGLGVSFVTGQSNYFGFGCGFGFTTLD